jgi:N-carbamoyl-L-amino-acid hydrolase
MGSHLDTQPTGGRFDGILGVLAGLEVLQSLIERGVALRHPLEIVDWTNEEGSRFAPAMLGSGAHAGIFPLDEVHARTDAEGNRLDAELARIGYLGTAKPEPLAGYFELHIEQGPVLEAEGLELGIVTGVQGMRWFDVEIEGECCHAGTTPMALRRDPVPALAALINEVQAIGNADPGRSVSTIGMVEARPGSRNTVPQTVSLTVDLRHPGDDALTRMETALFEAGERVAARFRVGCTIRRFWNSPPVAFDARAITAVREAAETLGLSHRDIVSGAGHDAVHVARIAPTAMIFVPCAGGISHNPRESITPRQAADGAAALLHAVLRYDESAA